MAGTLEIIISKSARNRRPIQQGELIRLWITRRQADLFVIIAEQLDQECYPSYNELRESMGHANVATVQSIISQLKKQGLIIGTRQWRSIRLTDFGKVVWERYKEIKREDSSVKQEL